MMHSRNGAARATLRPQPSGNAAVLRPRADLPMAKKRSIVSRASHRATSVFQPDGIIEGRLKPMLRIVQLVGFFPNVVRTREYNGKKRERPCLPTFWRLLSLFYLAINGYFTMQTLTLSIDYATHFGEMHVFTVTSIITGLKPLVNCVSFALFNVYYSEHRRMLNMMNRVDKDFVRYFSYRHNITCMNISSICFVFIIALIHMLLRLMELIITKGNNFTANHLADLSLLIVPAISIWATVPLLYFAFIQRIIYLWCTELYSQILLVNTDTNYPLKFYYKLFCGVTELQSAASDLFGPWISMSLGWCLGTLCLTIYFTTQARSYFDVPYAEEYTAEELDSAKMTLTFNIGWSILQILVAAMYIVIICRIGILVNENSRRINQAVLMVAADCTEDEENKEPTLTVMSFVYRMQSQSVWGVTVWRAFTLERTVFFTMFSLIMTYAFLLLRFRTSATDKSLAAWGSGLVPIPDPVK